jgi:hypothetical protein
LDGQLLFFNKHGKSYCCLGVAGSLCQMDEENLVGYEFLRHSSDSKNLPEELKGEDDLPGLLSQLNDGTPRLELDPSIKDFKLILRSEFDGLDYIKMNFNQIADFIEDNVEFY